MTKELAETKHTLDFKLDELEALKSQMRLVIAEEVDRQLGKMNTRIAELQVPENVPPTVDHNIRRQVEDLEARIAKLLEENVKRDLLQADLINQKRVAE